MESKEWVETEYMNWLEEEKVEKTRRLSYREQYQYEWMGKDILHHMAEMMEAMKRGEMPKPRHYRDEAIQRFSFAILDRATVDLLIPHGPYLEVGCGTGYWAYELRKAGVRVVAVDPQPLSDTRMVPTRMWTDILPITAKDAIRLYKPDIQYAKEPLTLLTVWPSSTGWPAKALSDYRRAGGQKVVYVGEGSGGCTGNDVFHEQLDEYWEEVECHTIPQWFDSNDYLTVYRRK